MRRNNKIIGLIIFTAVLLMPVLVFGAESCEDQAYDISYDKNSPAYQTALYNCQEAAINANSGGGTAGGSSAAAGAQSSQSTALSDPLNLNKKNPIPDLANRLILVGLSLSGVMALMAFIYGGILYMLAGVNPKNVEKGKEVMKYAVMGLFIIFSSYAIVNFFLKAVLGIK